METVVVQNYDTMTSFAEQIAEKIAGTHPAWMAVFVMFWIVLGCAGALFYRLRIDREDVTVYHILRGTFFIRSLAGGFYIVAIVVFILYVAFRKIDCIIRRVEERYGPKVLIKVSETDGLTKGD